jgi:hypothetical protein
MANELSTATDLQQKAAAIELAAVDFLDSEGRIAANRGRLHSARFTFIDGEVLVLPESELMAIDNIQFRLRPNRDDA